MVWVGAMPNVNLLGGTSKFLAPSLRNASPTAARIGSRPRLRNQPGTVFILSSGFSFNRLLAY